MVRSPPGAAAKAEGPKAVLTVFTMTRMSYCTNAAPFRATSPLPVARWEVRAVAETNDIDVRFVYRGRVAGRMIVSG